MLGNATTNSELSRKAANMRGWFLQFDRHTPQLAKLASVQTQCCEIHGVDLLVATVRPGFQPPPKARYSPTRLVVTDV
jgi:hypothetical protein